MQRRYSRTEWGRWACTPPPGTCIDYTFFPNNESSFKKERSIIQNYFWSDFFVSVLQLADAYSMLFIQKHILAHNSHLCAFLQDQTQYLKSIDSGIGVPNRFNKRKEKQYLFIFWDSLTQNKHRRGKNNIFYWVNMYEILLRESIMIILDAAVL